ncbi:MAG: hypothetical protein ACI9FN_001445, partial [Saprospiraceae bacterium]
WANAGRGWIEVRADALNPRSLMEAMESGDFYSSTGVELKELEFNSNKLSIEVEEETGITYEISFIGCKKGKTAPEEFLSVDGTKASFELTDDIQFVRSKIVSSKLHSNPIEDLIYETAWTQPVLMGINK